MPARYIDHNALSCSGACARQLETPQRPSGSVRPRAGRGIRELARLQRSYGRGRWLKRKGVAMVPLGSGVHVHAELHWYEAHGIGREEYKIKRILDE
jgi:hypothetical protein